MIELINPSTKKPVWVCDADLSGFLAAGFLLAVVEPEPEPVKRGRPKKSE